MEKFEENLLNREMKIKRAADIHSLQSSDGWKWINTWVLAKIKKLDSLKDVLREKSNFMVTDIRKRQTAIECYEGLLIEINRWKFEGERASERKKEEQKKGE